MHWSSLGRTLGIILIVLTDDLATRLWGDETNFAGMLPETTAIYLQLAPAETLLSHPLRERVEGSEPFKGFMSSPQGGQLRTGIGFVQFLLGDTIESVAKKLTHGGAAIAVDRKTEGVALIAKAESPQWLDDYLKKVVKLARDNASGRGAADPIEAVEYRGLTVWKANRAAATAIDGTLVVVNKPELGKVIVDRMLDKAPGGLSSNEPFKAAWGLRPEFDGEQQRAAWAYVDVAMLREAGVAKGLFREPKNSFGAELILGGVLAILRQTSTATADLSMSRQDVALRLATPIEKGWMGEPRDFFFGKSDQDNSAKGYAAPLIEVPGTLASLSSYRDVAALWLRAGDLFDEQVNDRMAEADATLTTLFSGHDFGTEILGGIYPQLRLVIAKNAIVEGAPVPEIKLPTFAIVTRLRDPQAMRGEYKRIFQTLVGFINITGAMNGQPQLDLDSEKVGEETFYTATFLLDANRPPGEKTPIQFNFRPTLGFAGDRMILSSNTKLAEEVAKQVAVGDQVAVTGDGASTGAASNRDEAAADGDELAATDANTMLRIDAKVLKELLTANRDFLIAQNMLEKGHGKEAAERELGFIFSIVDELSEFGMSMRFDEQAEIGMRVKFDAAD
jgi:hypothetical protein